MKKVAFLMAVLSLFFVVMLYLNQEKDMKAKVRIGESSYMDDVSIVQKKEGMTKWIVNARKALFVTENDVKLTDMKIIFPEKELTLTSDGGLYQIESRNLTIDGNVKASTKDYDIHATTLLWDAAKNEIVSDEKVTIVGQRYLIEGNALEATADKAKLNNRVKATFYGK